MMRAYVAVATTDGVCGLTGKTWKTGEKFWKVRDIRTGATATYHLSADVPFGSESEKRQTLSRLTKKDIRDLCFSKGIASRHGERRFVRKAHKNDLVKVLMGELRMENVTINDPNPAYSSVSAPASPAPAVDMDALVKDVVAGALSAIDIRKEVADALRKQAPTEIVVKRVDGTKVKAGLQHKFFPMLLEYLSTGANVFLVGPAGSGKTRAAAEVARCLGLKFYAESVSQQTPVSVLKGYMDAHGKYVTTNFRRAFEDGGLFLLDEIDAGNPNVITSLNAAVSVDPGQAVSFPDAMVKRHDKFLCIAAGNTFGRGADRQYVGRNPLDAASLDRFVVIEWEYDEKLEEAICSSLGLSDKWVKYVQAVRAAAGELKIRLIVSPRAAIYGGKLLKAGRDWQEVETTVLWKGMDEDSVRKLQERAKMVA